MASLLVEEELDVLGLTEEYLTLLADFCSLKRKLRRLRAHKKAMEEDFPQLTHLAGNTSAIINKRVWAAASGNLVRRVVAKDEDEAKKKLAKLLGVQEEAAAKEPPNKKRKNDEN